MRARETIICWQPIDADPAHPLNAPPGSAATVPWPDRQRLSAPFLMTGGAAYKHWKEAEHWKLRALILETFVTMTVRDGVPVEEAHRALLGIDEYRSVIAPDVPGADPE